MLDSKGNVTYRPNAQLARAIDVMFVLHADHELNCSTAAMRHLASSGVDVFSASVGDRCACFAPRCLSSSAGDRRACVATLFCSQARGDFVACTKPGG